MQHKVDIDYGSESVIKPIGNLAQMIEEMTMEEYLIFMVRGIVPDRFLDKIN